MNRKANTGFAVILFAVIILVASVMLVSNINPSLTGASVFDPVNYVPDYCFNNAYSCINLNGDSVIDGEDEAVFAGILDETITNQTLYNMSDFNNDGNVTNELDFQKCFVPLRDYYQDIEGGLAFCNLPTPELSFERCQQGCPDLDGNGIVEQDDYIVFTGLLGNKTKDTYYPGADMDADGFIGTKDRDCMNAFFGDIVTCNMPRYFQHTNGCPDLADENGVGNDGYVTEYDRDLFEQYWADRDLEIDFNGDGSITWIDRVIFLKYYEHNEVIDCNLYHAPWHVGGINRQNTKFDNEKALLGGANNLSQSFAPTYTGQLTKVRLHLKNTTTDIEEVVIDVYEENETGGPNQTYLIGSTALVPSFELNRSSWITIPFNNPPTLYDDRLYHLVVNSPDSENDSYEWYYNDISPKNVNTANASWYGKGAGKLGYATTSGDINSDGYDDVIIGDPSNDEYGPNTGQVYIFYGPVDGASISNVSNADAFWYGNSEDLLGYSLDSGDFNGDGYDDIIVGAEGYSGYRGAVYVVYGKEEKFEGAENISKTTSLTRWVGESAGDYAGYSVVFGDINNDGYDDFLATSSDYGGLGKGAAYVVYGPHYGNHSLANADVKIYYETNYEGFADVAMGDLNDDDYADLVIGTYNYDYAGVNNRGAVNVFYGPLANTNTINITDADDTSLDDTALWYGQGTSSYVGTALDTGDVNNDGYDDIIIGSRGYPNSLDKGAVYVVYGPTTGKHNLDTDTNASFVGISNSDKFGYSVASGDVDNDGYDDIIIGSSKYSGTEGAVYIVYGPVKEYNYQNINQAAGTTWFGESSGDAIGGASTTGLAISDINKDGLGDIIIGSQLADYSGSTTGKTYLMYSPFTNNVNGSYWNQTSSSGWQNDSTRDFMFQAWMSAACADLDVDGDCDGEDDVIIFEIPDQMRYSGTPGWNERYDLTGNGIIDSEDSNIYIGLTTQIQIVEVDSCESSSQLGYSFGYNHTLAQSFRADAEYVYYAGVYLKLYNGSGTKDIKVEIREPDADGPDMDNGAQATGYLEPVTESTYGLYKIKFDSYASLTANGLYYLVLSSPDSPKNDEYLWKMCNDSVPEEQRAVLIKNYENGTYLDPEEIDYNATIADLELSFVIYEGNNDSINTTLDVNNDGRVDSADQALIEESHNNWSGRQWSSKVDFNAEFGLYEKLKDYTLGFKAYREKVVTCSLPNWPAGKGNGRCDSAAPYYETFETAPEDCPPCNYDYFCASSEDFTYCPDCLWPAEIPHYNRFGCSTTEFFNVSEIDNVSDAIIEDCDYGKIELLESANFTGLSLDNDINFSQASLSIISPTLDALNKPANIYLYDLGYLYPWILHDGAKCSESKCTFESYIGEDIKFGVSTLGTYNEWDIQTVDGNATYGVGRYSSSLDIDDYKRPHISYYDEEYDNLRYAKWDGIQWLISQIDETGNVGQHNSIKLDAKNQPHISYHDLSNGDLKYAHFNGLSWNTETLETSGTIGKFTSIAVDEENYPHISYFYSTNFDLKYAYYNGSSWTTVVVESTGNIGSYTSLALNSTGHPHLLHYDSDNSRLKHAFYDGSSWNTTTIIDESSTNVGHDTSLAVDANDKLHASYYDITNTSLKYAYYDGSSWNTETVDNSASVGKYTSIALDSNNNPHISYYDETNKNLKYAYYDGSNWNIETVDNTTNVGEYTSIALDKYDNVYISYYDNTSSNLLLASYLSKTEYEIMEAAPDITDYNGSATTNLSINTGIGLANVSNFTIENEYGKIEFLVPVNLSPLGLERLNLTEDINITHNYISINTERLPMLSRPARLYIYNLGMIYPNVLRNYLDCHEDQCEFVSYNDGTLVFDVASFSSYSAKDAGKTYVQPFLVFSFSILFFFIIMILLEITKGGKINDR